ncbi:MAG: DUF4126 domain-containing protein [Gemmatimonadetes bacterium]|nr:DUF4126 domain-containing protein [Gemmatimonadota bacterium]
MGLGLVSGVNLYAAVLTVGLGLRLGLIHPYAGLSQLQVLTHPAVLATAGALYVIEFFADKIPWVDSLWDTIHTVIRPLGGALVAATAVGSVNPAMRTAATLVAGGVAFSSHSTKAGTRVAVNHSPEPFSNILLSLVEDGFAIFGTWLAVTHPVVMMAVVVLFLGVFAWVAPKLFRLLRVELIATRALMRRLAGSQRSSMNTLLEAMPPAHRAYWENAGPRGGSRFCVRCVAGRGVIGLRNSVGYLHHTSDSLHFVARRLFRFRSYRIDLARVGDVRFKKGILLDRLSWRLGDQQQVFMFFKHPANAGQHVFETLQQPAVVSTRTAEPQPRH